MVLRGKKFEQYDRRITKWMANNAIWMLRISIGIVFTWFGILKLFPGLSPAEALAGKTMSHISFGLLDIRQAMIILGIWEALIGLGLLAGVFLREVLFLLFIQMVGTVSPVVIFPEEVFKRIPFVLSLEGQYIFKNLVLISSGIAIGATVRGGRLDSEPLS